MKTKLSSALLTVVFFILYTSVLIVSRLESISWDTPLYEPFNEYYKSHIPIMIFYIFISYLASSHTTTIVEQYFADSEIKKTDIKKQRKKNIKK